MNGLAFNQAMLMAAGLGKRLRPITERIPKPMVEIAGKSLVERTLEKLHAQKINKIVINLHYRAELLRKFIENLEVAKDLEIIFSDEAEQLEAGGIVKALPYFDSKPFYLLNSDFIWFDHGVSMLAALNNRWDETKMDCLLAVKKLSEIPCYSSLGDFDLDDEGQLYRKTNRMELPYVFCSSMILAPSLFTDLKVEKFSFFRDFIFPKKMDANGKLARVYGLVADIDWFHIGTVEELEWTESYFRKKEMTLQKTML
jgi:MurNAc alpha-1-phosphate uridylyltransferase